jgi:hypothetical protein
VEEVGLLNCMALVWVLELALGMAAKLVLESAGVSVPGLEQGLALALATVLALALELELVLVWESVLVEVDPGTNHTVAGTNLERLLVQSNPPQQTQHIDLEDPSRELVAEWVLESALE